MDEERQVSGKEITECFVKNLDNRNTYSNSHLTKLKNTLQPLQDYQIWVLDTAIKTSLQHISLENITVPNYIVADIIDALMKETDFPTKAIYYDLIKDALNDTLKTVIAWSVSGLPEPFENFTSYQI